MTFAPVAGAAIAAAALIKTPDRISERPPRGGLLCTPIILWRIGRYWHLADISTTPANACFWHKADMGLCAANVRY
jgi:hypothetical protein